VKNPALCRVFPFLGFDGGDGNGNGNRNRNRMVPRAMWGASARVGWRDTP